MSYMEHKRTSVRSRDHKDFSLHFRALKGLGRTTSTSKVRSSGFVFPFNTLGSYRVTEIPVEVAAGALLEWERLFANAHAADDVTLGDKLAAIPGREWNSHTCLGYEVKEFNVECLATHRGGETINESTDVMARMDHGTSCCGKAIGQRPTT